MNIPKSSSELSKDLNINPYELSVLLNKRVAELVHGAKLLIENSKLSLVETVIQELISGKIKPNISL